MNSNKSSSNKRIRLDGREVFRFPTFSLQIEEEESAIRKLKEWNFDPKDVTMASDNWFQSIKNHSYNLGLQRIPLHPMLLFARLEDIPMMKYILLKSGNAAEVSRCDSSGEYFPIKMFLFSNSSDRSMSCSWLKEQGASLSQRDTDNNSLFGTILNRGYVRDKCMILWLLEEGALLNERREFEHESALTDIYEKLLSCRPTNSHEHVKKWAKNIVLNRQAFLVFLSGTQSLPDDCGPQLQINLERKLKSSDAAKIFLSKMKEPGDMTTMLKLITTPLYVFNGHPGIMERIADFAGIEKGDKLRTANGLVRVFEEREPNFMMFRCWQTREQQWM